MKSGRVRGLKCGTLLTAVMLTFSSSGCALADNPGYLYANGVASGVLNGLISLSIDLIGQALSSAVLPA